MYTTLITVEQLMALQAEKARLMVFDCSFDLMDPAMGEKQYLQAHVPFAVQADLDRDLSDQGVPDASGHLQPHPDAALGLSTVKCAPPRLSTKSTAQPRTRSRLMSSTSKRTPSVSAIVSPGSGASARPNLYWNPEQPPPSTDRRRIAGLFCRWAIHATRFAAVGVSAISGARVAMPPR